MTLLWTIVGIALALGIARYNKSNRLFWQLVLAFIAGYATIVMYCRTFDDGKKGNENLTQVRPMQGPIVTQGNIAYLLAGDSDLAPTKVTAFNPASQEYVPEQSEIEITPSEVFGRTRDQPTKTLTQPPETWYQKDVSTHHDYG